MVIASRRSTAKAKAALADEWWVAETTPLVQRCIRSHGWSEDFTHRVLNGYKQFLQLKVVFADWDATQLSPSLPVDHMWHLHILDNRNYRQDCLVLCNGNEVLHDLLMGKHASNALRALKSR